MQGVHSVIGTRLSFLLGVQRYNSVKMQIGKYLQMSSTSGPGFCKAWQWKKTNTCLGREADGRDDRGFNSSGMNRRIALTLCSASGIAAATSALLASQETQCENQMAPPRAEKVRRHSKLC